MKTFLIFMIGASLGSFFGLVTIRFPEKSICFPPSHCDHCQRTLTWRDLIPIFSQLIHHFRCRYCHTTYPRWYWCLELACGLLFVLTFNQLISVPQLLCLYTGLILAIYDWRTQTYPFIIWLLFFLPTAYLGQVSLLTYLLLLLALIAQLGDIKIGAGDFLYLASLSLVTNVIQLALSLQIACISALIFYLFKKSPTMIPFVPFILLGYGSLLGLQLFMI